MSAALGCLAVAVLLWADERALRRLRVVGAREPTAPRSAVPTTGPLLIGAVGCTTAVVGAVLSTALVAVLAAGCAALAVRAWAGRRRTAAEDTAVAALTEALGVMAAELRSGRSLEAATGAAVAACASADEECARALATALRAPGAPSAGGGPFDRALARVSGAVLLSARTGCSLAAVLGAVEEDLRARRGQQLELQSATAGARASATLLAALPLLGLAMGNGVGADPWGVLTSTGTGQLLLVAGVVLEVAGLAWSGRLVRRVLP